MPLKEVSETQHAAVGTTALPLLKRTVRESHAMVDDVVWWPKNPVPRLARTTEEDSVNFVAAARSAIEVGLPCGKLCSENPECLNEVRLVSSPAVDGARP